MAQYTIEGNFCFMTCAPGTEPEFQFYDFYPDGRKRYLIREQPTNIELNYEESESK